MKQLIQAAIFIGGIMVAMQSAAHEGHEHAQQLDQVSALETASVKMMELIETNQLSSQWATQVPAGAQLARIDGRQNWIVSYVDASAQQRLELIFTTTGEFVSMAQTPITGTAAN